MAEGRTAVIRKIGIMKKWLWLDKLAEESI